MKKSFQAVLSTIISKKKTRQHDTLFSHYHTVDFIHLNQNVEPLQRESKVNKASSESEVQQ